jgi:hypothetical protein
MRSGLGTNGTKFSALNAQTRKMGNSFSERAPLTGVYCLIRSPRHPSLGQQNTPAKGPPGVRYVIGMNRQRLDPKFEIQLAEAREMESASFLLNVSAPVLCQIRKIPAILVP